MRKHACYAESDEAFGCSAESVHVDEFVVITFQIPFKVICIVIVLRIRDDHSSVIRRLAFPCTPFGKDICGNRYFDSSGSIIILTGKVIVYLKHYALPVVSHRFYVQIQRVSVFSGVSRYPLCRNAFDVGSIALSVIVGNRFRSVRSIEIPEQLSRKEFCSFRADVTLLFQSFCSNLHVLSCFALNVYSYQTVT